METTTIKLPKETRERFHQACRNNASTASQTIRYLIDQYLMEHSQTVNKAH